MGKYEFEERGSRGGYFTFFFWMVATKLLDARHNSNSDFLNFNNENLTSELTFPDF